MSAAPEFMDLPLPCRERSRQELKVVPPRPEAEARAEQTFWQWFAIGVLIFCWIAEATMCAERGF